MITVPIGLGIGLLVLAVVDLFWTTLWVDGGVGPALVRQPSGIRRGCRRTSAPGGGSR